MSSFVDPKLLTSVTGRYGWVRLACLKLGQGFVIFKSSSHIAGGLLSMPSHLQSRCSSRLHLQSSFRVPDSLINHPHVSYNRCNFTLVWYVSELCVHNARTHSWRMEDDCGSGCKEINFEDFAEWRFVNLQHSKTKKTPGTKWGTADVEVRALAGPLAILWIDSHHWTPSQNTRKSIVKPNATVKACKRFQSQSHAMVY